MPICAHCGAPYTAPIYRTTLCEQCGRELKTCRNCRHFSPGSANDCLEPVSELVIDKEKANFCDWFSPAANAGAGKGTDINSHESAKKAFDDLFSND